jgi:hypothetical protein
MRSRHDRWIPLRPKRHNVRLACQVVRERDFTLIADRILDLSEIGMLVAPTTRVLTGERVLVSFMAPFTRIWVDAEATIARVSHGRRPGDRGPALGVSFDNIDDVSRRLLRRNLVGLPPPLPAKRHRERVPAPLLG